MLVRPLCAATLALITTVNTTDRRTYTFTVPPGGALSADVTVGDVRVLGESRRDIRLDVVRTAPTPAALTRIPVTIEESSDGTRVVALQAEGADPSLRTDLTMRVPRESVIRALRVMEGRVVLAALTGDVMVDLRRGPIQATSLQGTIRLETGIGDVAATDLRLTPGGLIRLRAFNGEVRLSLAERPADARIMALALNGTIQSQIPLTTKDTWGPRWGEATIGRGEPVISLDVVTGRIEIKIP